MATRLTPSETVSCSECGVEFELAQRNLRRHRRLGTPHRCRACRLPGTSPSAAQIEEAKVWWLSRYTLDELRSWPMA